MAVPPHGLPEYNRMIPQGADTALMFAARAGDLASAKMLVEAGANPSDHDAWGVSATTLAAFAGHGEIARYPAREGRRSQQRHTRIYGTPLRHHAARRSDRRGAARAWRESERAGDDVDADPPIVGRLSLHAGARRCDAVLARGALYTAGRHAPAREARRGSESDSRIELRAGRRLSAPEGTDDRRHGGAGDGRRHRVGADRSRRAGRADTRNRARWPWSLAPM